MSLAFRLILCMLVTTGAGARALAGPRLPVYQTPAAQAAAPAVQEPAAPVTVAPAVLQAAVDKLGDLDYGSRSNAARTVRRTSAAQAVPVLLRAVAEHTDGYVRYRALVLLTGFNDPRTKDAMRESLASPNDRLRAVAYSYFEHNPERTLAPAFLAALGTEQGEFVRPSLVRAAAAVVGVFTEPGSRGDGARVEQALVLDVSRGEDFFRSAVIEALGDYKAQYAVDALITVAKLDGPLQDDAALALGKIGDKRSLETLAGLQRTAPRKSQPTVAAAICLLGVNCASHENYLIETLKFADKNLGFQELLRGAASGLGALGIIGHANVVEALFDVGIQATDDATRAPVALAIGAVALRNTSLVMPILEKHPKRTQAISLLAEGFDMLEEDLDKERFFAFARRTYWDSTPGSTSRALMQTLIGKLEF